jgi:hypothetical protein
LIRLWVDGENFTQLSRTDNQMWPIATHTATNQTRVTPLSHDSDIKFGGNPKNVYYLLSGARPDHCYWMGLKFTCPVCAVARRLRL